MRKILFLFLSFLIQTTVFAQTKVYEFDLHDEINPASWRSTKIAMQQAKDFNAEILLINMNTYGGMLDYADSIRTAILNSKLKTIVFINNNAASAGALISIACDKIYMAKGASIGAASVVNGTGEVLPEKYQSFMRGLMRATAESKGRDPKIAEGFVDPDLEIIDIKPKGKVLTFTTAEAIKNNYCNGEVNSVKEILVAENIDNYVTQHYTPTLTDKIINFLIKPAVSSFLILLIIGGIYFEIQTPGIGLALVASIVGAVLFFAPLYLEGLADNWEILIFVLGLIFILLEIFVIPGFGIFGILGIVLMLCGLSFSLVLNNFFDFNITSGERLVNSFILVLISMVAAIVICVIFGGSILKSKTFKRLVLADEQKSKDGYQVSRHNVDLIGKVAIAHTDLRPSGKIKLEHNIYDAVSEDGYIENKSQVIITKIENYNLVVRKIES